MTPHVMVQEATLLSWTMSDWLYCIFLPTRAEQSLLFPSNHAQGQEVVAQLSTAVWLPEHFPRSWENTNYISRLGWENTCREINSMKHSALSNPEDSWIHGKIFWPCNFGLMSSRSCLQWGSLPALGPQGHALAWRLKKPTSATNLVVISAINSCPWATSCFRSVNPALGAV